MNDGEMNQETANRLFDIGAFIVFLAPPPAGIELGIDLHSWELGRRFSGLKLIPPGLHFIHSGGTLGRCGWLHYFAEREVVVANWDASAEKIVISPPDPTQSERLRANLESLDPFLGAYPLSATPDPSHTFTTYQRWLRLAKYITPTLVHRLVPSGAITEQHRLDTFHARRFEKIIPARLISRYRNNYKDLLAELQLSFIVFVVGQVYDGLEQWKVLVTLWCSCLELVEAESLMFVEFTGVLLSQLEELPHDFFVDAMSGDSFLRHALRSYASSVAATSSYHTPMRSKKINADLVKSMDALLDFVEGHFDWELRTEARLAAEGEDDEEGEYAPVVVDLDANDGDEAGLEAGKMTGLNDDDFDTVVIEQTDEE
ncbi:hypothetical protein SeMB42_g04152 [Synchytrium endobioticum]|uniref:Uncharacterized protein n=1 Tax=Synchytrium endobioticum TaxID=286115 RepID=A0A507D0K5_9FUNG|nr:hypothetical protein SeMB42_g04152 [Synchytrium endobioticum]